MSSNTKEQKAKDLADMALPNQGVGFLSSNSGTTVEYDKARRELENEKKILANAMPRHKNKWTAAPTQPKQQSAVEIQETSIYPDKTGPPRYNLNKPKATKRRQ